MTGFPQHVSRKQARRRRTKRRLLLFLLLVILVVVATLVLKFLGTFENYSPKNYDPKDLEREKHLKSKDKANP